MAATGISLVSCDRNEVAEPPSRVSLEAADPMDVGPPGRPELHHAGPVTGSSGDSEDQALLDSRLPWARVLDVYPLDGSLADPAVRARIVDSGWPWRIQHVETGIEMLLVPPGEFMRGNAVENPDHSPDEHPQQPMIVTHPFYLGVTEVTRAQWNSVMASDPTSWEASHDGMPVTDLSFEMIQEFLEVTGLDLPRDSEWEYACKAGSGMIRYGPVEEIAWYSENSTHPMPVAQLMPNAWGFYDMIGNVWEYTRSRRTDLRRSLSPDVLPVESDDEVDTLHIALRGGGGGLPASEMRATKRGGRMPDQPSKVFGFRVSYHPMERLGQAPVDSPH
jgi:formylglycine-generating enzyme required for sulfatase activity